MAYQLSKKGKQPPVIDGLTGDERFFYGWGTIWGVKSTDKQLIRQIKTDPHSPGEFRANIHLGGTAQKIKITPTERKIAILAAKTLNLKVAGVDIIRGKNSPLLLEVNSSPGLEGIEGVSTKDIAGTMIEAIEKDLKFRK